MEIIRNKKERIEQAAQQGGIFTTATAGNLLCDWGNLYQSANLHTSHTLGDFAKEFTITGGEVHSHRFNTTNKTFNFELSAEEAANIFGLAYTSSSSFAALWVCNVSAVLTCNKNYHLHGMAINTNFDAVFVFEEFDQEGDELQSVYLTEKDLQKYIEEVKSAKRAEMLDIFNREALKGFAIAIKVLNKYEGKQYGEKTAARIREEIRTATQSETLPNLLIYLNGDYIEARAYLSKCGYVSKQIYLPYTDNTNRVIKGLTLPNIKETKTATQARTENKTITAKIVELCKELCPLLELFNHNNSILQSEENLTNQFSCNVYSLSKWGL